MNKGKSGYSKKEIENYLEQIALFQQKELEELEEALKKHKADVKALEIETAALQEELEDAQNLKVLELAYQRLDRTCSGILKTAEEDAATIENMSAVKMSVLYEQIKQVEKNIKTAKNYIQNKLGKITRMVQAASIETAFKIDPETDEVKEMNYREDNFSQQEEMFAEEYELEDLFSSAEGRNQEIAAAKEDLVGFSDMTSTGEYTAEMQEESGQEIEDKSEDKPEISPADQVEDRENWTEMSLAEKESVDDGENAKEKLPNDEGPEVLKRKIDTVRYKYMVGKLAGEDLLDDNENLIIGKDREITLEVIETAQREGKLSELIINMTIPGMDEES